MRHPDYPGKKSVDDDPGDEGRQYRLLNIHRAEDKTHEAEAVINKQAEKGWEVVGYSAFGWRGITKPGFSHLVLFKRSS